MGGGEMEGWDGPSGAWCLTGWTDAVVGLPRRVRNTPALGTPMPPPPPLFLLQPPLPLPPPTTHAEFGALTQTHTTPRTPTAVAALGLCFGWLLDDPGQILCQACDSPSQ